jgi:hypothetical protein
MSLTTASWRNSVAAGWASCTSLRTHGFIASQLSKDAGSDIPIRKEAKAEYAKLQ